MNADIAHTAEPWLPTTHGQVRCNGGIRTRIHGAHSGDTLIEMSETDHAGARQCVNFCAGVHEVELQAYGTFLLERARTASDLKDRIHQAMQNGALANELRANNEGMAKALRAIRESLQRLPDASADVAIALSEATNALDSFSEERKAHDWHCPFCENPMPEPNKGENDFCCGEVGRATLSTGATA